MAYSDFTLQEVAQRFQLVIEEQHNLFAAVPDVVPGDFLCALLDENVPLALALSREQLFICAPMVVIVEAKNENFKAGMGQCSATMMAAQCFNARADTGLTTIYGAVTTGNVWKFLQLEEHTLFIDLPEYHIERVGKILGILLTMVGHHPAASAPTV